MQRCLGVDGAGHKPDGTRCGVLTRASRCQPCATYVETRRTQGKRARRPYTRAEQTRRAQTVAEWVAEYGWLCPGWRRPPHSVHEGDLTAEHPHAVGAGGSEDQALTVLCRSCNSAKADQIG
jgi:hypothetical protein